MYIPTYGITMDKAPMPQIRLGLQGAAKTGKTYGATTFPNTNFVNLDRGLGAHLGRADITEIRLYLPEVIKLFAPDGMIKTAIENFIEKEAPKFTAEQTLVLDGSTGLQNAYHKWYENGNQIYTKSGKLDEFGVWNEKLKFFTGIMEPLKALKCNVIYICHETDAKDKKTQEYTGKIKPLLTGSFGDELASHFTDWFRCHSTAKPKSKEALNADNIKNNWRMTVDEFMAMCDSFKNTDAIYFWQTQPDDQADCGCSSLINPPRYIPATYQSFLKYMRKPDIQKVV